MLSRWIDHLPAWMALLALAGTGIYEAPELAFMALPLVAALSVELRRLDLSRWRVPLEIAALALFVIDLLLFRNIFAAVIHLLCILTGLRLALPRHARERHQLLLMSFLLFLTTAISTADMLFLSLALLWSLGAMALLVQLSWEHGAHLRRGLMPKAPFGKLPLWLGASGLLGALLFIALPRMALGLKPLPILQRHILGTMAGLGDTVDLSKQGPIQENGAAVMRITPLGPKDDVTRRSAEDRLGLLRGMVLESVQDLRWEPSLATPLRERPRIIGELESTADPEAEFFLSPNRAGILPLPYGTAWLRQPPSAGLRPGEGASLHWAFLPSSGLPLRVGWHPTARPIGERGGFLSDPRRALLTTLGREHDSARRLSEAWAPGPLSAPLLATRLQSELQRTCSYTLDNPSGSASNPLAHFLEVSHAGHCEYFASALALMLRAKGVPARLVAGYRLGPWIPEGGYFLVTQNQAHTWVEYWDDQTRTWNVADPTPAAAMTALDASAFGSWSRTLDALRYRWNRYVVRYSDQDQMEGLTWAQSRMGPFTPARPRAWGAFATLLVAAILLWRTRSRWRRWTPAAPVPGGVGALRPLLRRTQMEAPPMPGETLRAWLGRLAGLRPDLSAPLKEIAASAEAHVYGGKGEGPLRRSVAAVVAAWKRPT